MLRNSRLTTGKVLFYLSHEKQYKHGIGNLELDRPVLTTSWRQFK